MERGFLEPATEEARPLETVLREVAVLVALVTGRLVQVTAVLVTAKAAAAQATVDVAKAATAAEKEEGKGTVVVVAGAEVEGAVTAAMAGTVLLGQRPRGRA